MNSSKTIFVDWHGVLSTRLFWEDLNHREPRFGLAVVALFSPQQIHLVEGWMRGTVTEQEIVDWIAEHHYHDPQMMLEELMTDASRQMPKTGLLTDLKGLDCRLVLATDNMRFAWEAIKQHALVASVFDGLLCSCDLGVLKSESPQAFFGGELPDGGFADCLLLDDSEANCQAFREAGGTAIRYDSAEVMRVIADVRKWAAA